MSVALHQLSLALLCVVGAMAASPAASRGSGSLVGSIAGEEVRCVLDQPQQRERCARAFLAAIRARAESAFVAAHGLHATESEIAELRAYDAAFERHDRDQRARKLAQLEARLQNASEPTERERLERFRAVLVRLARYEADVDAGVEPRVQVPADAVSRWIEASKLDATLYARYGGVVGISHAGPYAHGAKAALAAEYLASGQVVIVEPILARRVHQLLMTPPSRVHEAGPPDFTPYWKRPIPPSYMDG
jgi:hypothetical protein